MSASLEDFSMFSVMLPLGAACFNYKHLNDVLKIAALLCMVSALSDISAELIMKNGSVTNSPVYHIYIIISTVLFAILYYKAFTNPVLKKLTLFLSSVALLLIFSFTLFIQNIWQFPSISGTVRNVLLTLISLLFFYQLLSREDLVSIEKQGLFWINSAVLIYSAINIFLFMLFSRLTEEEQPIYYGINSVTNIVANLLFAIGLLCKPQKTA